MEFSKKKKKKKPEEYKSVETDDSFDKDQLIVVSFEFDNILFLVKFPSHVMTLHSRAQKAWNINLAAPQRGKTSPTSCVLFLSCLPKDLATVMRCESQGSCLFVDCGYAQPYMTKVSPRPNTHPGP
jgi:hypothetical protein